MQYNAGGNSKSQLPEKPLPPCRTVKKLFFRPYSPFTPTKIIIVLEELKKDIYDNIKNPLQQEVKRFMQEMCDKMSQLTENKPIEFKPLGVVNRFFQRSKSHNDSIKRLRGLIREYLMVDEKFV